MPEIYTYNDKFKGIRSKPIKYVINAGGCWECVSHRKNTAGYVQVSRNGVVDRYLHRYIYELEKDKIPEGMEILHSCDNRICFNPAHLSFGTRSDNMKDMVLKNRHKDRNGEKNQRAKLKESDIPVIRSDTRSIKEIATIYSISTSQVKRIKNRMRWAYIKDEGEVCQR